MTGAVYVALPQLQEKGIDISGNEKLAFSLKKCMFNYRRFTAERLNALGCLKKKCNTETSSTKKYGTLLHKKTQSREKHKIKGQTILKC